ncbi:C39 family peptidase [Lachnospira multipara]|uniref:C39 family peptidase n=1 Tax=Lachnospira multipara TaxID=28051 RepID=UPI0004E0B247|nr:C39 family peptidase [Lachnospira multipara]
MKKRKKKRYKLRKSVRKAALIIGIPLVVVILTLFADSIKRGLEKKGIKIAIFDVPSIAADRATVEEDSENYSFFDTTATKAPTMVSVELGNNGVDDLEEGSLVTSKDGQRAYALIYCWIRTAGNDRASKASELYYGDEVIIKEVGERYTKVETDTKEGYVRNDYLSSTKPTWVGNLYNNHKIHTTFGAVASDKYVIKGFPLLSQKVDLPSGCEISSLAMVLNYHGVDINKDKLVDCLETGDYGDNIFTKFIGNVREDHSFGCMAEAICNAADEYLELSGNTNLKVGNISGTDVDGLLALVAAGYPVIVWGTEDMKSVGDHSQIWNYEGVPMGFIKGEHCLVLIGFDRENDRVIMADPLKDNYVEYSLTAFKLRYRAQFSQAVLIY